MKPSVHPLATSHHPSFITAPGDTDVLMIVAIIILASAVFGLGLLYLKLYNLPLQFATTKLQY